MLTVGWGHSQFLEAALGGLTHGIPPQCSSSPLQRPGCTSAPFQGTTSSGQANPGQSVLTWSQVRNLNHNSPATIYYNIMGVRPHHILSPASTQKVGVTHVHQGQNLGDHHRILPDILSHKKPSEFPLVSFPLSGTSHFGESQLPYSKDTQATFWRSHQVEMMPLLSSQQGTKACVL